MPLHTTEEILERIKERNSSVHVSVNKIPFDECAPWYYNEHSGMIELPSGGFFRISGLRSVTENAVVEQPIIVQPEIGYLGIIRKPVNGEMHYLMQLKTEPGNVNKIQISPTVQATKSNFTRAHGGLAPPYLEFFTNAKKYKIIADQIQSEQSSRFLGKRNRNIIIELAEDEAVEVLPTHIWMTLRQIKELMRYENLVNMDTRTVISCLPPENENITNESLKRSAEVGEGNRLIPVYGYINDYKMFNETDRKLVPLLSLKNWKMRNNEFVCDGAYNFKIVFCDIEIEGREVKKWCQPLLEAAGIATFGLLIRIKNGAAEFLVRAKPEIGCFDKIELGPSVQREFTEKKDAYTDVDLLFDERLMAGAGVKFNNLLSEEGGRFYRDQNRNVIIEIGENELNSLPEGCFWVDYGTLSSLLKINNCLNVQLRNLLSVLEW